MQTAVLNAEADPEPGLLAILLKPHADAHQQWRALAADTVFRVELRRMADRLVRQRRLPRDWRDDVEQESVLLLRRSLLRKPDLGFVGGQSPGGVLPWLRAVIRSYCREAIRRRRAEQSRYRALTSDPEETRSASNGGRKAQLWAEVEELPPERQRVVRAYLEGGTIDAAARKLAIPWSTARDSLRKSLDFLKRRLPARDEDTFPLRTRLQKNVPIFSAKARIDQCRATRRR